MSKTTETTSSEILDRLPPQSLEAEKAVLGSMLLDPLLCDDVAPILRPEDFYARAHRKLYAHMLAIHDGGGRIDAMLLVERLKAAGELEAIGGVAYLAEVAQSVPVAAHAMHYAGIVVEKSRRRAIILAATEMLRAAWDTGVSVDEIVSDCEALLHQIPSGEYAGEPVEFTKALAEACVVVDEIASRKRSAGLMTGLESFDFAAGGLFAGELTILAARPSIGKTSLALQIAQHVGGDRKRVYFASLEMPTTQLALRVLCGHSGVAMARVRSGDLGPDDLALLMAAGVSLQGLPILLHDRAGLSVADIRRACRRMVAKGGLDLVIVDYLQRVTPADAKVDRHLQVGKITWDLKALALELRVPVLCVCQLGRVAEERDRKTGLVIEPRLSMLKESGDIEQDADMVLLLHRQQRAVESLLILAKNRQGEQARFNLQWDGERTRFSCDGVPGRGTAF